MGGEKTATCQKQLKVKSADSTKDMTFRKHIRSHTCTSTRWKLFGNVVNIFHVFLSMCDASVFESMTDANNWRAVLHNNAITTTTTTATIATIFPF